MSYYQKYRPKRISDLNLTGVRDTLGSVLKNGKVSHAYLFVGPRGSGKTSAARILASVVNCEENKNRTSGLVEPCGECLSCVTLNKGGAVDVIEIDAASNGLVDDIRDLREKVKLAPVSFRKKVYIIDEVHMVSAAGFNALLKTLEEPPAHCMFILCTTESHKVPETIVSRCIRIPFTRATEAEMIDSLQKVIAGENLKIVDTALPVLVQMADGSFREAHKLLEQLAGFGVEINDNLIIEKLGGANKILIKMAVEASLAHDSQKILEVFGELERNASKASVVLSMLIGYLKEQLTLSIKSGANAKEIVKLLDSLIVSSEKIKVSPEPLLPLELALLEIAVADNRGNLTPMNNAGENSSEKPLDKMVSQTVVVKSEENEKVLLADTDKVVGEWNSFLDHFANNNGSLAGLLRNCKPKGIDGKSLVIEVKSRFQKDMLERDVKKKVIEEEMSKVWGPVSLKTVLQEVEMRTEAISEDANVVTTSLEVEKIFG